MGLRTFFRELFANFVGKEVEAKSAPVNWDTAPKQKAAPGTSIRYDPELIGGLLHDHSAVRELVEQINRLATDGRLMDVPAFLLTLRNAFKVHVGQEDVKLYIYMKYAFAATDKASADIVAAYQNEMSKTGRVVDKFISKYQEMTYPESALTHSFAKEWAGIVAALADRMEREETTLYPLYKPVA